MNQNIEELIRDYKNDKFDTLFEIYRIGGTWIKYLSEMTPKYNFLYDDSNYEYLIARGFKALKVAIDAYNLNHEFSFFSFATFYIYCAMNVKNWSYNIEPINMYDFFKGISTIISELDVSIESIPALYFNILPVEELEKLMKCIPKNVSYYKFYQGSISTSLIEQAKEDDKALELLGHRYTEISNAIIDMYDYLLPMSDFKIDMEIEAQETTKEAIRDVLNKNHEYSSNIHSKLLANVIFYVYMKTIVKRLDPNMDNSEENNKQIRNKIYNWIKTEEELRELNWFSDGCSPSRKDPEYLYSFNRILIYLDEIYNQGKFSKRFSDSIDKSKIDILQLKKSL